MKLTERRHHKAFYRMPRKPRRALDLDHGVMSTCLNSSGWSH
jgi:hypothetical protein